MSASSASLDPVLTVVDLLNNTAEADWPSGTKPDPIERRWESSRDEKRQVDGAAAYVYSPDVGTREQLSTAGETKDQQEVVDVEVWARAKADGYGEDYSSGHGGISMADSVASDVESILEDYWNDRQANTEWHRIRPQRVDDRRGERSPETTMGRRTNQYIVAVRVELRREDDIGT